MRQPPSVASVSSLAANTPAFIELRAAEPDLKAWANRVALNPARIAPGTEITPELARAQERLATHVEPGLAGLAQLAASQVLQDPVIVGQDAANVYGFDDVFRDSSGQLVSYRDVLTADDCVYDFNELSGITLPSPVE